MSFRIDVALAGMKMAWISYLHQSSYVTRCIVIDQNYFEKNPFSQVVGLNSGFKIFSNPCHK